MTERKKKILHISKLCLENAARFVFNISFVFLYQFLFGQENILAGVAVSVALTMYPDFDLGIRPATKALTIAGLFIGCAIVPQLSALSPWLALPLNFAFVALIMMLSAEPISYKPSICYLLCFVFCQATPVTWEQFPVRLLGLAAGGAFVGAATWITWKLKGIGKDGRRLREQVQACCEHRGLILRMALGISAAMFAGMILGLKKPLWISIVVMSLTQLKGQETILRIKHRAIGTVLGVLSFIFVFRVLVPEQYAYPMILLIGYVSFFLSEYKYKQVVNAVCALNASMVFLDTTTAVENRIFCLLGGIAIVLLLLPLMKLDRKKPEEAEPDQRVMETPEKEFLEGQEA